VNIAAPALLTRSTSGSREPSGRWAGGCYRLGMPEPQDTGPNTEMFKAFVARGEQERSAEKRSSVPLIVTIVAAVVVVVAVVVLLAS
jgi:hypothetical protein